LHIDSQRKRRNGVGSAIRRSIPVRTFADWRDPPPGFFEIDMVEHCGGVKAEGEFVHTLTMTDIASGWTECVAMRVRDQMLIIEAFEDVAAELPFTMLGVDSGNDSAFMSLSVFDYCKGHGLEQTRSRAYKKNGSVAIAAQFQTKLVIGRQSKSQRVELRCGVRSLGFGMGCPFLIMCIVSMPAMKMLAQRKDLNPSIDRTILLMTR